MSLVWRRVVLRVAIPTRLRKEEEGSLASSRVYFSTYLRDRDPRVISRRLPAAAATGCNPCASIVHRVANACEGTKAPLFVGSPKCEYIFVGPSRCRKVRRAVQPVAVRYKYRFCIETACPDPILRDSGRCLFPSLFNTPCYSDLTAYRVLSD